MGTCLQPLHVNYPFPCWHQAPNTSCADSSHSLFGQIGTPSSRLNYILFYYKLDPKHPRCFMKCSSFPDCNVNQKRFQPSTASTYSNERHASFHAFLAMCLYISYLSYPQPALCIEWTQPHVTSSTSIGSHTLDALAKGYTSFRIETTADILSPHRPSYPAGG